VTPRPNRSVCRPDCLQRPSRRSGLPNVTCSRRRSPLTRGRGGRPSPRSSPTTRAFSTVGRSSAVLVAIRSRPTRHFGSATTEVSTLSVRTVGAVRDMCGGRPRPTTVSCGASSGFSGERLRSVSSMRRSAARCSCSSSIRPACRRSSGRSPRSEPELGSAYPTLRTLDAVVLTGGAGRRIGGRKPFVDIGPSPDRAGSLRRRALSKRPSWSGATRGNSPSSPAR
jgi:hypothetical protein